MCTHTLNGAEQPSVYVVVPSYNGMTWLEACLQSVLKTAYRNFHIIMVDNASSDCTPELVRRRFPAVEIVHNTTNVGFAAACNVGICAAMQRGADYVALVNQDVIVDEGWLEPLVDVCERYQDVAVVSPTQLDYSGTRLDKSFARVLGTSPEFLQDLWQGTVADVYFFGHTIGAVMLVSRRALMKVGLFDEMFFCYGEDIDFCRRVIYHGCRVAVCSRCSIRHWHSLLRNKGDPSIDRWMTRARLLLALKEPKHPFIVTLCDCALLAMRRIVASLVRREYLHLRVSVGAVVWLLPRVPKVFLRRLRELS